MKRPPVCFSEILGSARQQRLNTLSCGAVYHLRWGLIMRYIIFDKDYRHAFSFDVSARSCGIWLVQKTTRGDDDGGHKAFDSIRVFISEWGDHDLSNTCSAIRWQ